jgi:WD40 repeat protein
VEEIVWSPDGTKLAVEASPSRVWVLDAVTGGRKLYPVPGVTSLTWSPKSTHLAVATGFDGVQVRDVATGDVTHKWKWRTFGRVSNVAWSPKGTHLAVAAGSDGVRVLDVDTGGEMHWKEVGQCSALQWSPSGAQLSVQCLLSVMGFHILDVPRVVDGLVVDVDVDQSASAAESGAASDASAATRDPEWEVPQSAASSPADHVSWFSRHGEVKMDADALDADAVRRARNSPKSGRRSDGTAPKDVTHSWQI